MKLTKRKGFNFFRSYFDVYNELEDQDKLAFIDALLNRQFLGIIPENLSGMAKFAYISQTNSIDSQVKGYEDKTGTKLTPCEPPSLGGAVGGSIPPRQQVEDKVEDKGKVESTIPPAEVNDKIDFIVLLDFIKKHTGRNFTTINESVRKKYKARIKEGYSKEQIKNSILNAVKQQIHKDNGNQYLTPEFFSRSSTIEKYGSKTSKTDLNSSKEGLNVGDIDPKSGRPIVFFTEDGRPVIKPNSNKPTHYNK